MASERKTRNRNRLANHMRISNQHRASRRKKIAKTLERQARKLRAKGIAVDLESLRAEYLSQHQVTTESDLEDDDAQIDVVGDADGCSGSSISSGAVDDKDRIALASLPPPPLPLLASMAATVAVVGQQQQHPSTPPPQQPQPLMVLKRRDSIGESVESGESDSQPSPKQSNQKRNSFSIDSLLYNRS